jgi:alkanesulfonate monooxygenase SsuD/methylene tetrahydromethanopterin reductase-like flavin-dependent oxidoreductase (luciferase family)
MAYAAACSERIRLGAVLVSTLHSPLHPAKSIATLDQLSRGGSRSAWAAVAGTGPSPRSTSTGDVRRSFTEGWP